MNRPLPNGDFPKRIYEGKTTTVVRGRVQGTRFVTVNGSPISQRQDISQESVGVNWGYGGAGPAQLGVALTADALGDVVAQRFSYVVEREIVQVLKVDHWTLTDWDIYCAIEEYSPEAREFLREYGQFH